MASRADARTVAVLVVAAGLVGWVAWSQLGATRPRDLEDLQVGDCVTVPSGDFTDVLSVPVVGCDRRHNAELYLMDRLDRGRDRDYPGADVARAEALDRCAGPELAAYVGGPLGQREIVVMWPSEVDWWPTRGAVHCFVRLPGDATTSDRIGGGE